MNRPTYRSLCTCLLLFCISHVYSQDLIYKNYSVQDGLASPTIHSIFQDSDGFLWFGTESGLCRYDGSRFKTFSVKDGLSGNEVFGMLQDKKGRIWLQQYKNSIAYIYKGKVYNQQNDSVLKKITLVYRVLGIAEDAHGNVGLSDGSTLYVVMNDNTLTTIPNKIGNTKLPIVTLSADSSGQFIVCSHYDQYQLVNNQFKYVRRISPRSIMGSSEVLVHPNYIVYGVSDSLKLIYLRDTVISLKYVMNTTLKYSAVSDSVFSINTFDGAVLFNIKTQQVSKVLPAIKVTNVFLDRERNLWLGTIGKGAYKLSSQSIVNKKAGNIQNDIFYIVKSGNIIVTGNNSSEIYEYSDKRFVKKSFLKPGGLSGKIQYYESIGPNSYIAASANGMQQYDNGVLKKQLELPMMKQVITADRKIFLLATHSGLYAAYRSDFKIRDTLLKRRTLCVSKTGDTIFAGTSEGLFLLKRNKGKWKVVDSLLNSSIIAFMQTSADNLVWVCTYEEGLYALRDGRILWHFTDTCGLPSNNGRSLHARGNDVWMGTDRGLIKISRGNDGFHFQKYSSSDGLPSDNINSIYVDGDTVYIGTSEGLCYFDETKIETTSFCNLVLTGVKIGDSTAVLGDKYYLRRQQRFVVEFAGISFRSEKEMSYRYKIKGIDDTWRNTTVNSLEFTSLPYGDYQLEIIATNKFGKESPPLSISFSIVRPFHKTGWFTFILILFGVSVVFFAYTRWLNFRRQKQLHRLKQEIKYMELEQMALRAQMNPHFIFNCINAMQQLVLENDTENANRFLTSFSELVRQTLDNAPELYISLKEEIKFLTSYFELERIRLEDRFSYSIDTSGIEDTEQAYVPNMVIQPFAENAIKHGVRYKKDGRGVIELKFAQHDGILQCTVTDNGIGREMASSMKKQSGDHHVSKGMGITFKRIESLNALASGKISIAIYDLKDEQGKATGTQVVINFNKL